MVQKNTVEAPKEEEFPVIDETGPEQLAIEAQVVAGKPEGPPATPEAAPETTPEAVPEETPVVVPEAKPATAAETRPEPARVFSEEQVRQMQSSWDRQIAQERKRAQEASERLQQFDLNASVEAHLRSQERQLESTIGADEARKAVRTPDNERQVREGLSAQQRVRALEERQRTAAAEQEFSAAVVTAQLFMQRYGVPAEDAELLLSAQSPVQMEKLAQRLGSKTKATTADREALRKQVPVETSQTKLESGMSGTSAPESIDHMTERLNMKPSWEWTEREREFMRTGRV